MVPPQLKGRLVAESIMAKKGFNVHIIKAGMEAEYRMLMLGQVTDASGKQIRSDLVMSTVIIEAVSLPAAKRIVREKYPNANTRVIPLD